MSDKCKANAIKPYLMVLSDGFVVCAHIVACVNAIKLRIESLPMICNGNTHTFKATYIAQIMSNKRFALWFTHVGMIRNS